jgi:hypothetical protein
MLMTSEPQVSRLVMAKTYESVIRIVGPASVSPPTTNNVIIWFSAAEKAILRIATDRRRDCRRRQRVVAVLFFVVFFSLAFLCCVALPLLPLPPPLQHRMRAPASHTQRPCVCGVP